MKNKKALILGAGVVGISTALALHERGYEVVVLEQAQGLGLGASGNNGGQLSYNYTDALASPDILKSLPRLLMGLDQAFRLSPFVDWDFVKWSLAFLQNSSQRKADLNTLAVLELALKSKSVLARWRQQYDLKFDFRAAPKLHLYESDSKLRSMQSRIDLKNQHGACQEIIDRDRILDLEPALSDCGVPFVGGVYSPDEEVGDVKAFVQQAARIVEESERGQIEFNSRVVRVVRDGQHAVAVETESGLYEFDFMVVCGGYQSSKFAASNGMKMPVVYPVAGYSLSYELGAKPLNLSITDTSTRMVYCRLGNKIRIAGMADVGRRGRALPKKRIELLKKLAQQRFPNVADYSGDGSPWMGARPMTASSQPVIKKSSIGNVYINSGHGMLGWTLAPISSQILADLVEQL